MNAIQPGSPLNDALCARRLALERAPTPTPNPTPTIPIPNQGPRRLALERARRPAGERVDARGGTPRIDSNRLTLQMYCTALQYLVLSLLI